jgi:hypothetical protein
MLRSRRLEAASPDLADRIARNAEGIVQNQTFTLAEGIKRLFAEFHLPKPAYVLAGALLLGLATGYGMPVDAPPEESESAYVQALPFSDEALL